MEDRIYIDRNAQNHIQAYLEYKNIVGDTDGGKLLTEKEFAKRKQKALEDQKNRVYVTWLNDQGLECRSVGPSSKCFCGHKFRDHDAGNKQKRVFCKMPKCKCKLFEYIPIRGSQDLKCHCKHSFKEHNISTRRCLKKHPVRGQCRCDGFYSSFGCSCGQPFSAHRTLFESREERQKAGKRVDNLANGTGMGCPAMGGLTSFSSLIDGIDRLAVQQNASSMNDLRLQFMKPKPKLTENEEMAIYASKYDPKPDYRASNEFETPSLQIYGTQQGATPTHSEMKQEPMQAMVHYDNQRNMDQKPMKMKANVSSKLKLLKKRRKPGPPSSGMRRDHDHDLEIRSHRARMADAQPVGGRRRTVPQPPDAMNGEKFEIEQRIQIIEQELKSGSLSAAKKFALNKSLKMERSKIIRYQRKAAQDKRRFEAGL